MSENDNRTQTFDDSELPEWAIHEEDQESLNAFFNEPADRGKSETAFAIPRGESDPAETVSASSATIITPAPSEVDEAADAPAEQAAETPAEEVVSEAEPAPEEVSEAAPEVAPEPVVEAETEAAPVADEAANEAPESQTAEEAGEVQATDEAEESEEAPRNVGAPRREDFARFRCIYESQDGQLALYEDEEGHLTAVNTNRFI